MTGDAGGKRLWNESAGSFIYHIHSIRQCGAVNQCPWFFLFFLTVGGWEEEELRRLSGEGSGTRRERVAVTARLSRLSQIQFAHRMDLLPDLSQTPPALSILDRGGSSECEQPE